MSTPLRDETGTEAVLRTGDVFVFTPRDYLNALVQVFRGGQPLLWETPIGHRPAYSLGAKYDRRLCIEHARDAAARDNLQIGEPTEAGGRLHVPVV